ncbi:hypothetical protein A3J43_00285 [Candidatus Uhrbacteria bacterium RIFCSPHIGHO2_12_FULL_54_23]|uniref:Toxin HicA n=3 Tax=Candidatus Uhriibacteriota TaxID=1752732 RepID=A0A1F7UHT7_9BACT|nr:MAG: hypothetical protein A3J43_00285 [Candidatus Uhrbacteria bacterium RIFCSPHIGHO2_12_FULL_54_23]OGL84211.1 MAG: hypothetical protein A3B36_00285 [Candidatus Uhrbacteria bacterium RIFCSPLOWO2_01_FULL_55_36]OGL90044.1 MAG: hypothetical protein A3J36_00435 [Candidatus Uhrbacteria bacterium RIFCSPLOWO2_02_FULL_54_37]
MSQQFPSLTTQKLVRFFLRQGFYEDRQSGSHLTLKHSDGRCVTVPIHTGKDIGKGLLSKIIKGAGYSVEEFNQLR